MKEKQALNIVEEKAKKAKKKAPEIDPAEERAMKELNKVAAYQARIAKRSNKQKKIRTVLDDTDKHYNKEQRGIEMILIFKRFWYKILINCFYFLRQKTKNVFICS